MLRRCSCIFVLSLIGLLGCSRRPDSQIVAKFRAAGGGDPASADVPSIGRWLSERVDLTVELYNMCRPSLQHIPDANWPLSDEGKICQASLNNYPVKFKSDGVKF